MKLNQPMLMRLHVRVSKSFTYVCMCVCVGTKDVWDTCESFGLYLALNGRQV